VAVLLVGASPPLMPSDQTCAQGHGLGDWRRYGQDGGEGPGQDWLLQPVRGTRCPRQLRRRREATVLRGPLEQSARLQIEEATEFFEGLGVQPAEDPAGA
jgi:hypothetical protein